jgi:hypothetical protein
MAGFGNIQNPIAFLLQRDTDGLCESGDSKPMLKAPLLCWSFSQPRTTGLRQNLSVRASLLPKMQHHGPCLLFISLVPGRAGSTSPLPLRLLIPSFIFFFPLSFYLDMFIVQGGFTVTIPNRFILYIH